MQSDFISYTVHSVLIKVNLRNVECYIIMKWSGWPLTATIVAISLAISYILFHLGVYFFFLPIIFCSIHKVFQKYATFTHMPSLWINFIRELLSSMWYETLKCIWILAWERKENKRKGDVTYNYQT
jgi:hypothetical protein